MQYVDEHCSVEVFPSLCYFRTSTVLVGYAGCGKTALINGSLQGNDPTVRLSTAINFNFYTSAQALQVRLVSCLRRDLRKFFVLIMLAYDLAYG